MAQWTPTNLDVAPLRWYRAANLSQADDSAVSSWTDASASADHAVQATTTKQPKFKTNILNGKPVVRFDGGDYLELAELFDTSAAVGSMFVVYKNNGTYGSLLSTRPLSGNSGFTLRANSSIQDTYFHTGYTPALAITVPDQFLLIEIIRNGLSIVTGVNGVVGSAASITGFAASTYGKTAIGAEQAGTSSLLNGDIAEIIILGYLASATDRQLIEGYLLWEYGLEASLPAGHPYESAAPTIPDISALRAILTQLYALEGSPRALMAQDWNLMLSLRNVIDQDWSLRMLQVLSQYYGDVPVVRQLLEQYWGPAAMLRRLVAQPYGDALRLRAGLDQDWGLNAGLLALLEQRYSVAGDRYLALAEQVYNIKDTELIQKLLDQVYIIQPSGITVQKPVTSVTASATSLFPQKTLHPYHIEIEVDEEEFAIKGEIHLADESEWISCVHTETELTIPIDGTEYHLLVEGPWKSRQPGLTEYYVPMASKTILLDAPYADGLEEELGGKMASVIAQDLADIGNITVNWDMIDWFIPLGALYANGETPLAVIRKIVGAAGGVLQSSPAGNLICRAEYPVTVPNWSIASPDFYLTDSDNFFSVSSKPDIRDGFNRFSISDQDEGTQGLTPEEVPINSTTKHILVYQVPFKSTDTIVLRTSGGTWVGVINEGVVTEDILDEQVEIVGGEGNTTKPIYGIIGLPDYKETELGVITTSESGVITTAILENSLVNISYTTKYRKFIVTDPNIEDVQFFPEIQP